MTFSELLTDAVRRKKTSVLVGLDPRFDLIPAPLKTGSAGITDVFERFCCEVIDVVAPLVPAVKPQAAFFEQYGPAGMTALGKVIKYARKKGLLVIFDGKRNDIGSTAEAYAAGILGADSPWGADALTVSPYLGDDSLEPFFKTAAERNAGIFVLVKTSNPGGKMLQDIIAADKQDYDQFVAEHIRKDGSAAFIGNVGFAAKPIYCHVAEYIQSLNAAQKDSTQYGSIGAVVGATWPEQLAELRSLMPNTWFLVPGFGSQGGSAKDVEAAFDSNGLGAVINNSRGILFAYQQEPFKSKFGETKWQQAVEAATLQMIEQLPQPD